MAEEAAPATDRTGRNVLLLATLIAVAALLARWADGSSIVPVWLAAVMQAPALLAWCHWRCGWFGLLKANRRCKADPWVTAITVAAGTDFAVTLGRAEVLFAATTVMVAGMLLLETLAWLYRRIDQRILESAGLLRIVCGAWMVLLLAATVLLSLPLATHSAVPDYRHNFWDHVLNSAFAAVSAGCLVGTTIYSLGQEYSTFGQAVLVGTTQLAGMGFAAVGLAVLQPFMTNVIPLRKVLRWALALQALGVLVLWGAWSPADAPTAWSRLWWGIVHATGALWNGGLVLRDDGLMVYIPRRAAFAALSTLAVIGSLGLPLILDLIVGRRGARKDSCKNDRTGVDGSGSARNKERPGGVVSGPFPNGRGSDRKSYGRSKNLSPNPLWHGRLARVPTAETAVPQIVPTAETAVPHTIGIGSKTAARTRGGDANPPWRALPQWDATWALILLLVGAAVLWVCETPWPRGVVWRLPDSWVPDRPVNLGAGRVAMRDDMSHTRRWTTAVFISATVRSAGLQSIPLSEGAVSWPSFGMLCVWMFLGGSAGGTGGGIRTSVLALLGMVLLLPKTRWTSFSGGTAARRLLLWAGLAATGTWLVVNLVAIAGLAGATHGSPYQCVFEATAACNSVGLTTGMPLHLTVPGRVVMIVIMLAGRIAPLMFWLAVSRKLTRCLRSGTSTRPSVA